MNTRCPTGKRRHTVESAEMALTEIWSTPQPGGRRLPNRYYQCPLCPYIHLTSEPRKY